MKTLHLDPTSLAANPRASLPAWLRYSDIVLRAYNTRPHKFTYIPTSHSTASVASKLRDAIRGKLAFDYPFSVPNDALKEWWGNVVVTFDKEKVYIGAPEKRTIEVHGSANIIGVLHFTTLSLEELCAFEYLLDHGRIKGPIHIDHPVETFFNTPSPLNVERITRPDGSLILL